MHAHKYQVGQRLLFSPTSLEQQQSAGLFEVTRRLPTDGTELQYRVKNSGSGQERMVRESQLRHP